MTAPSDALIVGLCALIYQPTAIISGFDHYDAGMDDGVCWALKKLDGCDIIVFRGSVTMQDWIRDFRALAIPSPIGHVHGGFYAGMANVWSEVRSLVTQPAIVTGHSLGAARAGVLTGLMIKDGSPPIARIVFGEPKPGLLDLAQLVKEVPARSYRNGDDTHHDVVTDVPLSFPPEQYVHPTPIVPVCAKPAGDLFEQLGIFAWHHIELYQAAVAASQEKAA